MDPTSTFVGREDELTLLKLMHHQNRYVLVTGPSGIGKSEMVRFYAKNYKSEQNANILWINSHSTTSMVQSFRDIATEIGLFNLYKELTKITSIIFYVLRYFEKKNTLLVFDGAQIDNVIIQELRYFYINNNLINVIITSKDSKCWGPEFYVMDLKTLSSMESILYMQNCFRLLQTYVAYQQYEELIRTLRSIPKALNVTCQYFLQEKVKDNFKIENFIKDVTLIQHLDKIEESLYHIAEEDLMKFTKYFENALVHCIFDKVIKPFDVNWVDVSKDYINLIKIVSENQNKLHVKMIDWDRK